MIGKWLGERVCVLPRCVGVRCRGRGSDPRGVRVDCCEGPSQDVEICALPEDVYALVGG